MKRYITAAAALVFLATAAPVLAQNRDDRGYNRDYNNGNNQGYRRDDRNDRNRDYHRNYNGDPRHHAWREGDTWHGHRVNYRNGHWGYYEPRNGTQFFVQFWL